MRHRRLQTIGQSHQLIMRALAPRTAVDGNPRARIEDIGDPIEFGVAGANDRVRDMHREGGFVRRPAFDTSIGKISTATPRFESAA